MSNICIGLIRADLSEQQMFKTTLSQIIKEIGLGIKFNIDWDEPIVDIIDEHSFVFSISDSSSSSDCEMFLLPDGCFYNDRANSTSFMDRMQFLQVIATAVANMGYPIEFYVGTSGTLPEEYLEYSVTVDKLAAVIASSLYSQDYVSSYPLHVVVSC